VTTLCALVEVYKRFFTDLIKVPWTAFTTRRTA